MILKEKNDIGKLENEYDQIFIKDNKTILYDESDKKDMKNSLDYLNINKLDLMFPKDFIDDIQNFSVPKLEYQNVDFLLTKLSIF